MNDLKATILGGVASIVGTSLVGFVGDALLAFVFGGIGALGGWLVNKLIKRIESKRNEKKKI
jgi:hypothetical protein